MLTALKMQTKNKTIDTSHELQAAPDLKKLVKANPMDEMRQANEALELLSAHRPEELAESTRAETQNTLLPNGEYSGVGNA
jgi:hypothetical protein